MLDTMLYLEERKVVLEELLRRSVGEDAPLVCRVCYVEKDGDDNPKCLCDRKEWTLLAVVVLELELRIAEQREAIERAPC